MLDNYKFRNNMFFVYITCANKKEAKKISLIVLKKRLAACANIFPIDSIYWWQGKLIQDKEVDLIIKTRKENYEKIKKLVKEHHRYSVPCIVGWEIDKVNEEYGEWLEEETEGNV